MNTHCLKGLPTKVTLIFILGMLIGCSGLKNIPEGRFLLDEQTILIGNKKIRNDSVLALLSTKPNSQIAGIRPKLWLYQISRAPRDLQDQPWLRKIGQAPIYYSSQETARNRLKMVDFYQSKGYFNAKIKDTVVFHPKKPLAEVKYLLDLGNPYIIDEFSVKTDNTLLDSLYIAAQEHSHIKVGHIVSVEDLTRERTRLTQWFKNNGVFQFQESALSFTIRRDTTNQGLDNRVQLDLNINAPRGPAGTVAAPFKREQWEKIDVFVGLDARNPETALDSLTYEGITFFYRGKLGYQPQVLARAIPLSPGQWYSEEKRNQTYRWINNLGTLRAPRIAAEPQDDGMLYGRIDLVPKDRYATELNLDLTHNNIQRLGIAFSAGVSALNISQRSDILRINTRGSIGLLGDAVGTDQKYTSEYGVDISLTRPELWVPFDLGKNLINQDKAPKTSVVLGRSIQNNIGLDRQTLNASLGYQWNAQTYSRHTFNLIDVQYVRNLNPDRFFNVYQNSFDQLNELAQLWRDDPSYTKYFDSLTSQLIIPSGAQGFIDDFLTNQLLSDQYQEVLLIEERRKRLTENNLISSTQWSYTNGISNNLNDPQFAQFRILFESAGGLLSLAAPLVGLEKNEDGVYSYAKVPFAQYVKTELSWIKHWPLAPTQSIAFRVFGGAAIPYGNASNIPFTRSYFAGGSNDNRAWNAYALGPGTTSNLNDFNEANFKLAANLEYRFGLAGPFLGALFIDAGNIWNLLDDTPNREAQFKGLASLGDLAVGTGGGLRYDFGYFLFRIDWGFKAHNPGNTPGNRWFKSMNFANSVINIGINYPF